MTPDQMKNEVDYLEPRVLRVRSKKQKEAWLVRLTDNGGHQIAHWKGETKMPPWVAKDCS